MRCAPNLHVNNRGELKEQLTVTRSTKNSKTLLFNSQLEFLVNFQHVYFSGGRTTNLADYADNYNSDDSYWISDLNCPLGSLSIDDCSHKGWGEHDCSPNQYAKLRCNAQGDYR